MRSPYGLPLLLLLLLSAVGQASPVDAAPGEDDDDDPNALHAQAVQMVDGQAGTSIGRGLLIGDGAAYRKARPGGMAALPGGDTITYTLYPAPLIGFPNLVDSNSPALSEGGELIVFNSAGSPARATGPALDALEDAGAVTLLSPHRAGDWWIEAVWRDPGSSELYGWYHQEPDDLECLTAPLAGAAVSLDNGTTWTDLGAVLESGYPIDCAYDNGYFVGGHGDFDVVLDSEGLYFYFLYSNYSGPVAEQGISVARSAMADRGRPGTVMKYFDGSWSEPGVGGRANVLFPTPSGWEGPQVEAFWGPSVHWNQDLGVYIALLNHTHGENWEQEGVYLSFSEDLLQWTEPQKVVDTHHWYPQVLGPSPAGAAGQAGASLRLYVGGVSGLVIEFDRAPRDVA